MANCPSVCTYRVSFSDGTTLYPELPGHVDVVQLAGQYAKETLTTDNNLVTVVSIERIR